MLSSALESQNYSAKFARASNDLFIYLDITSGKVLFYYTDKLFA